MKNWRTTLSKPRRRRSTCASSWPGQAGQLGAAGPSAPGGRQGADAHRGTPGRRRPTLVPQRGAASGHVEQLHPRVKRWRPNVRQLRPFQRRPHKRARLLRRHARRRCQLMADETPTSDASMADEPEATQEVATAEARCQRRRSCQRGRRGCCHDQGDRSHEGGCAGQGGQIGRASQIGRVIEAGQPRHGQPRRPSRRRTSKAPARLRESLCAGQCSRANGQVGARSARASSFPTRWKRRPSWP